MRHDGEGAGQIPFPMIYGQPKAISIPAASRPPARLDPISKQLAGAILVRPRRHSRFSPGPEEGAQQLAAFLCQEPPFATRMVVEALIRGQQVESPPGGSALGIGGAEHQPLDPGVDNGPGAHDARLQGDIEGRSWQPVVPDPARGLTEGQDLGMGTGVMARDRPVPALSDHLAVAHQHRTDRDLALGLGLFGQGQGTAHPAFIVGRGYSHAIVYNPLFGLNINNLFVCIGRNTVLGNPLKEYIYNFTGWLDDFFLQHLNHRQNLL